MRLKTTLSIIFFLFCVNNIHSQTPTQEPKKHCYVWDFALRSGEKTVLTNDLTVDFEDVLVQESIFTVLNRTKFAGLLKQINNEKGIQSLNELKDSTIVTQLKFIKADLVVFGELYEEKETDVCKISITVQDFNSQIILNQKVYGVLSKLKEVKYRDELLQELVTKIRKELFPSNAISLENIFSAKNKQTHQSNLRGSFLGLPRSITGKEWRKRMAQGMDVSYKHAILIEYAPGYSSSSSYGSISSSGYGLSYIRKSVGINAFIYSEASSSSSTFDYLKATDSNNQQIYGLGLLFSLFLSKNEKFRVYGHLNFILTDFSANRNAIYYYYPSGIKTNIGSYDGRFSALYPGVGAGVKVSYHFLVLSAGGAFPFTGKSVTINSNLVEQGTGKYEYTVRQSPYGSYFWWSFGLVIPFAEKKP